MLLVDEAIFPLIETQKDYLWNIKTRVVLRNDLLLGLLEWVVTNNGLYVGEAAACKLGTGLCERLEVLKQQEGGAGVIECRGQELMVGTQKPYTIEWRACMIMLVTRCRRGIGG
jgi:hypothetical protein